MFPGYKENDRIEHNGRAPLFEGPCGKAWEMIFTPEDVALPKNAAHVGTWLLQCEGIYPLWRCFLISVCDLADRDGVGEAHKRYPEAEYEIICFCLNPENGPFPVEAPQGYKLHYLTPQEAVEQFHGCTREQAKELGELHAKACVMGTLQPNSDFKRLWTRTVRDTAEHWRKHVH